MSHLSHLSHLSLVETILDIIRRHVELTSGAAQRLRREVREALEADERARQIERAKAGGRRRWEGLSEEGRKEIIEKMAEKRRKK